ncbi:unnamed protein product [Linum trigynum]|uniref:Uncharacterized protein n=1 Tax=Linum trigynum TaxID=586398 RepID=A0AAV2DYA3_9ROSI
MFVDVEYCHVPSKCEKCQLFGHDCSNPGGKTKKVWVVKQPKVKQLELIQDKGKEVIEESSKEMVQEVVVVEEGKSATPGLVQDEEGFQVVTHRKNRVRAPASGSVSRSPWSLSSGSSKSPLDDQVFPSLSRPVLKRPVDPPPIAPARGKGRGKKRGK